MSTRATPDLPRMLTPPQIARRYGCNAEKIIGWIRTGQLRAVNVSNGTRPRYRIDPVELTLFEEGRAAVAAPKPTKRRRRQQSADVIEFF